MNRQRLVIPVISAGLVLLLVVGCGTTATPTPTPIPPTSTATLVPPTATPIPQTATPTPPPLLEIATTTVGVIVVRSATVSAGVLTILVQSKNGSELNLFEIGGPCLTQEIYVMDETGSRLDCAKVEQGSNRVDQVKMLFLQADSGHNYKLFFQSSPPIDLPK